MADSKKDARQKAAEARAAQQAADKRRERTVNCRWLVVLIVIVAIIGGAIFFSKKDGSNNGGTPTPDAGGATPNGVSTSDYYVTAAAIPRPESRLSRSMEAPVPYRKKLEETAGPALVEQSEGGQAQPPVAARNLMDANLKNTGSLTATNAWGCAIDAGKTTEFHQGVFQQQAPEETVGAPGFTQQQMLDLGKTVGITGDAYSTFESCVKANTTYNVGCQQQRSVR